MENREHILDELRHEDGRDVVVAVEGHDITVARSYGNSDGGIVMNPVFLENTDVYRLEFFHLHELFRALFHLQMKGSGRCYVIEADICPECAEGESRYLTVNQTDMKPLPDAGPIADDEAKAITMQMGRETIELGRVIVDEANRPYLVSHTWYPGESGEVHLIGFDVRAERGAKTTSATYSAINFDGMDNLTMHLTFNDKFDVIEASTLEDHPAESIDDEVAILAQSFCGTPREIREAARSIVCRATAIGLQVPDGGMSAIQQSVFILDQSDDTPFFVLIAKILDVLADVCFADQSTRQAILDRLLSPMKLSADPKDFMEDIEDLL